MNLPYFSKSRFLPAVDIAILRAFRPDTLLTIDRGGARHPAEDTDTRRAGEDRRETQAERCLRLAYRLSATQSPRFIGVPNVVIAVKRPPKTIYGIALQGAKPRFYLSFTYNSCKIKKIRV
jgi:adenylate kinase